MESEILRTAFKNLVYDVSAPAGTLADMNVMMMCLALASLSW